jgi:hypothetical protein
MANATPGRFIFVNGEVPEGITTRDFDRENLVKNMVSYGLKPVFVEGDDKAIWVHFLPIDVETFEKLLYSNADPLIPLSRIAYADEWWRNLIVSWKSMKRYLDNTASKHAV